MRTNYIASEGKYFTQVDEVENRVYVSAVFTDKIEDWKEVDKSEKPEEVDDEILE